MKLTKEQECIIEGINGNANIKAFAGTGKTSTLIEVTKERPDKKFLYIAFNKSVQTQAAKKFPKNVLCKTIHSIAFGVAGNAYRAKLGNNRLFTVNNFIRDYRKSYFAQSTLKNFLNSADMNIEEKHINKHEIMEISEFNIAECLENANMLWHKMKMIDDNSIKMEHDGYLKLFHLNMTNFPVACDYILFDEAQDSNNVVYDLLNSSQIPIIAVGDHHQSIYGFRGAINSLKKFKGDSFHLTKSFRFGENVAGLANQILKRFKNEKLTIAGVGGRDQVDWQPRYNELAALKKVMKISRSNSGLISNGIECLKNNYSFHIIGGVNEELFKITKSVAGAQFNVGEAIKDPVIRHFYNKGGAVMENIRDYAMKTNDKEIDRALYNCDKYGKDIFMLLEKIKEKNGPVSSQVWLSTAHKAKGMECDNVILDEDFGTFAYDKPENIRKGKYPLIENGFQEINLLYVALTRAKQILHVNENINLFQSEEKKFKSKK